MGICPHLWSLKLSKFESPHWNLPLPPGATAGAKNSGNVIFWRNAFWRSYELRLPILPLNLILEQNELLVALLVPKMHPWYSYKKRQSNRKNIKRIAYMNKKYWIILFLLNIHIYLSNKNYLYMFNILFYWVMMCFQFMELAPMLLTITLHRLIYSAHYYLISIVNVCI